MSIMGRRLTALFFYPNGDSRHANQHNLQVNDKLNKIWSLFTPTVSLLTEIGLLVVWAFGIWLMSKQQITVGVLTAFVAYIGRFYGRLDSIVECATDPTEEVFAERWVIGDHAVAQLHFGEEAKELTSSVDHLTVFPGRESLRQSRLEVGLREVAIRKIAQPFAALSDPHVAGLAVTVSELTATTSSNHPHRHAHETDALLKGRSDQAPAVGERGRAIRRPRLAIVVP